MPARSSIRSRKEPAPRRVASLWRRAKTRFGQHLAHRRRRHADADTLELADDPLVSPPRVLSRETQDQLTQRALKRRPPSLPMGYVQRRATSWRCQRSSVSGLTGNPAHAARGSERLSAASTLRSAGVSFGCRPCRRSIASSWRNTRISSSFERRGRASSRRARTDSAQRDTQTTTKQPSLDDDSRALNLATSTWAESRDEFANPTGWVEPHDLDQSELAQSDQGWSRLWSFQVWEDC